MRLLFANQNALSVKSGEILTQTNVSGDRVVRRGYVDQRHHLNSLALRRQPSILRQLMPISQIPGMISLGAGYPNAGLFPFEEVSIKLKGGDSVTISKEETAVMLQYTVSYGLPLLTDFLKGFQKKRHSVPYEDWNLMVTTGSQDGLHKALTGLVAEGDTVLVETPTYSGALAILGPLNANVQGLECDESGIIPSRLDELLSNWEQVNPTAKKPHVLYTVPTGQNPAGTTLSVPRRKEIYRIACEHDIIIVEDDPYWFLTFGDEPLQSFFSLDTDRRVIRLDSLSKVLSSGLRTGWISGPQELIENFQFQQQVSDLHASGISQMMVYKILSEWGDEKFDEHVSKVQNFYQSQRDIFLKSAEKHLKGLATWNVPNAGMFIWLDLNGINDSEDLILKKGVEKKVLLVPGTYFMSDRRKTGTVRASYSFITEETCDEALSRIACLLKQ